MTDRPLTTRLEEGYRPEDLLETGIDFETYLQKYMGQKTEWYLGEVYSMPPISGTHYDLDAFLQTFLNHYLQVTGEGILRGDPFTMKLSAEYSPQPDLMVITTPHLDRRFETRLEGAADLVIEVVSPESVVRDRGHKFDQYEQNGVTEYWIIDPLREDTLFYVLDEEGLYRLQSLDVEGFYTSHILPRLRLTPQLFYQNPLPHVGMAIQFVNDMLRAD